MIFDHLFVILFAIVYPLAGFISFRRLLRRIEAGHRVSRSHLYRATVAGHWALFVVGVALWTSASRDFDSLGFGVHIDVRFALAVLLTIAGIVFLLWQLRIARNADDELLQDIEASFGLLVHLMPRNSRELAGFSLLALTAGIVEEVLWRGFLIWYLTLYLPLWAAALISILGFGVAHAYQGSESVPKITVVGAVFTGIYLLGGSLWPAIVLHAAVDLLQGRFAYSVITRREALSSGTAAS